jgi:pimeloyl-ACP methyl ester carboxylesterase
MDLREPARTRSGRRAPVGWLPAGRFLELEDGARAFVRTVGKAGSSPPVLLLHGLGATSALNWTGCYEALATRTQVIAVDHRGHGRGPRVGNRFRLADCADDAAAVLRALGTGPAVVAGYSMGGPIAQLLARRHPDLVAGLVLAATSRDFRGAPGDRLRFAAMGAIAAGARLGPRALWPTALPALPGQLQPLSWALAELRRHEPAALVAAAASLGRFTSRSWVHEIAAPTTVIVHARDQLVPPHRQAKLARSLPDARVVTIDADHLAISRAPEAFRGALVHAYDSVASRSRATAPAA